MSLLDYPNFSFGNLSLSYFPHFSMNIWIYEKGGKSQGNELTFQKNPILYNLSQRQNVLLSFLEV